MNSNTIDRNIDEYQSLAHPNIIIHTKDLYQAYKYICDTKGIKPLNENIIQEYLTRIRYTDHIGHHKKIIDRTNDTPVIKRIKFDHLRFIKRTYNNYKQWASMTQASVVQVSPTIPQLSNFLVGVVLITLGDISLIAWVIVTKYQSYSIYLLLARSGAAIILYNLGLLLVHVSNVFQFYNLGLIYKLSIDSSHLIHQILGTKIILGTIIHVLGHYLHVNNILKICLSGCDYIKVHTVPKGDPNKQILISWNYFLKRPSYYSGIVLVVVSILICIGIGLTKCNLIRSTIFYNQHRLLAIIFSIGIILHGMEQLLGFNLSYIFVLPPMLIYFISRYSEILGTNQLIVTRLHIVDSIIRIYFDTTPYLNKWITHGVAVSAYINHKPTSRTEWHPFTIFATTDIESCISIKGSGKWTKIFIQNMLLENRPANQIITLGHLVPSCFRFHTNYQNKIIFCSGIGITPFLSIIEFNPNDSWLLVWSINNIDLIQEFILVLNRLNSLSNLRIVIFYSNTLKQQAQLISTNYWNKFNFLQTLIHYRLHIDIIHGYQTPCIIILNRVNPLSIITRSINEAPTDTHKIGIFVCGGVGYTKSIKYAVDTLRYNIKKIKLDVWAESLS